MPYTNTHKLSAAIILLGLLLQSCGGENSPIPGISNTHHEASRETINISPQITESYLPVSNTSTEASQQIETTEGRKQTEITSSLIHVISKKDDVQLTKASLKNTIYSKKGSKALLIKTQKRAVVEEKYEKLYRLGLKHYYGIDGVQKSYQEAFRCFQEAAQNGHTRAQYELALMFSRGNGIEPNYQESIQWLKKAANQGDPEAQYELALFYIQAEDTYQNYEKAVKWLERATKQKHVPAINQLALLRSLSSFNANTSKESWEQHFNKLGAANCWQEFQPKKTDLYFELSKVNKVNLRIDQYNNILRAAFQYIICHHLPIKSLSIQRQKIIIPSTIKQLSSLQKLDLSYTNLRVLPNYIGELDQLIELKLNANQFNVFPAVIQKLTNLQVLDLSYNELNVIPTAINRLSNLKSLFLQRNRIENLPTSIGDLTQLEELDLYNNSLRAIPDTLFNLYSKRGIKISLSKNAFFKSSDLCIIAQQALKSYAYAQLPCSLRVICANAVLQYVGRVKPYEEPKKGIFHRTLYGLSNIFSCEEVIQPIKSGFEQEYLRKILPTELSLDNLQLLINQTVLGKDKESSVIFFKDINGEQVPCYLSHKLTTCQDVREILQKVKNENLKCYLTIP